MQDLPDIEPAPLYDDVRDYKHVHQVRIDSNLLAIQIIDYQNLLLLHSHTVIPSKVNYIQ